MHVLTIAAKWLVSCALRADALVHVVCVIRKLKDPLEARD